MKREEPLFDRNYWAGAMSVFLDDLILDGRAPVGAASPEWWRAYLAAEAQAIDRTHRIGQDKTVLAFRLVTAGTIEDRILELQEKKRGIVTEIFDEDAFNRTLTKEDLEFILAEPGA